LTQVSRPAIFQGHICVKLFDMKNTIQILLGFIFTIHFAAAQSPQGINYQAVARDAGGTLLANQAIGIQISITDGSGGNLLYQEEHFPTTNVFGLFTLKIGGGNATFGTFSTINWDSISAWMNINMDVTGGTTFVAMGSSQMMSVPYALHAASSLDNKWSANGIDITNTNTGNVGIGTSFPPAKLGVVQATTFAPAANFNLTNALSAADALKVSNSGSGSGISSNMYGTGHAGYFACTNPANTNHAVFGLNYGSGNALGGVHTGTGYAVYGFQNGSGGAGFFQIFNSLNVANALTALSNGSGSAAYFSNSNGPALTTGSGNVGIGVSNPAAKLHVDGSFRMADGSQGAGKVMTSDANGTATWTSLPAGSNNTGFSEYSSNSQSIPSGVSTQVNWTENYDDAGAFTGDAFTAPSGGVYHFDANLMGSVSNTASPNYFHEITLKKNGNSVLTTYGSGLQNAQTQLSFQLSADLKLNAGDVITVWVRQFSTFNMVLLPSYEYCLFTGHRVY